MTTPTPPEKIDFSPDSVEAAYKFVRSAIETVIETLEGELSWLEEMHDRVDENLGTVVVALANQYRDAPGFQNRWNLREKK